MAQTKPIIAIVNVVASATIDQKLDLLDITKKFPDVEYHPEQFPGAVFRLREPRTATLPLVQEKWYVQGPNQRRYQLKR